MRATTVLIHIVWSWLDVFAILTGLNWLLNGVDGYIPLAVFGAGCFVFGTHCMVMLNHLTRQDYIHD